ncbi:MAG: hypothetical protein QMD14_03225 [Candidatus Aenigmarchaeota archaeon]|nr:hypothetical protein [Candidatus Aenigmarchaeota archaeon]
MKGISPLIAVVLLIAFTIVIGGILLLWARGFVGEPLLEAKERAEEEIECAYGYIELSDLEYCEPPKLLGSIINRGTIKLKNLTIFVIYPAPTLPAEFPLCTDGMKIFNCSVANLSIDINELYRFNISTSSGFDEVRITTHCPGVTHTVKWGRIKTVC